MTVPNWMDIIIQAPRTVILAFKVHRKTLVTFCSTLDPLKALGAFQKMLTFLVRQSDEIQSWLAQLSLIYCYQNNLIVGFDKFLNYNSNNTYG